jgi:hypothetical protein
MIATIQSTFSCTIRENVRRNWPESDREYWWLIIEDVEYLVMRTQKKAKPNRTVLNGSRETPQAREVFSRLVLSLNARHVWFNSTTRQILFWLTGTDFM